MKDNIVNSFIISLSYITMIIFLIRVKCLKQLIKNEDSSILYNTIMTLVYFMLPTNAEKKGKSVI